MAFETIVGGRPIFEDRRDTAMICSVNSHVLNKTLALVSCWNDSPKDLALTPLGLGHFRHFARNHHGITLENIHWFPTTAVQRDIVYGCHRNMSSSEKLHCQCHRHIFPLEIAQWV